MDGRDHSGKVADGNSEHVPGNWRKGASGNKVAKTPCSSVFGKAELASNEAGYLTERLKSVKGMAWLLLTAYRKVLRERNDLRGGIVKEKGSRI